MGYSISEIAHLSGLTSRTIRYYDQIGLLAPAGVRENGYRYYDHKSLLRLQQIMFFRELEVPLKEIQSIMKQPIFSPTEALKQHRAVLQSRLARLENLMGTLDRTLKLLNGDGKMCAEEYFEGFDESKYEEEARQRWGGSAPYLQSRRKWANYTHDQKEAVKREGVDLLHRMVPEDAACLPSDPSVQTAIADYLAYLNRSFYTCDAAFLRGLSDMWGADARFAVNYERIRVGGAAFAREAVHFFCDQQK